MTALKIQHKHRKLFFFACSRFLSFHQFFQGVSWPRLPLCADARVKCCNCLFLQPIHTARRGATKWLCRELSITVVRHCIHTHCRRSVAYRFRFTHACVRCLWTVLAPSGERRYVTLRCPSVCLSVLPIDSSSAARLVFRSSGATCRSISAAGDRSGPRHVDKRGTRINLS